MRCPDCNTKLERVHREGWPTIWQCNNQNERYICGWLDPVRKTARWRALQKEQDWKSLQLVKQTEMGKFTEQEKFINDPNYLK